MGDYILYSMRKEPLEVQFNDTAKHKYVTIPSDMDIEPGQNIFPIAVDERWNEDWYPAYIQLDELLARINELIGIAADIATDYEIEKSSRDKPAEELGWLGEALAELDFDKISKFRRRLREQYNLDADPENMPDDEEMTRFVIRKKHGKKMREKYKELGEWQQKQRAEKLKELEDISHITSKGHEVKIHFSDKRKDSTYPLNIEGVEEIDKDVYDLIQRLNEIYKEREERFVAFAEELGYEHRLENTNLGFNQFKYKDFIVEVPMELSDQQDIDIMKKEN